MEAIPSPEKHLQPERARYAAALCAGFVAVFVVWSGLSVRDLTGDEIAILTGSPSDILRLALDPKEAFTGHMPWSYWLRWGFLDWLGPDSPVAWRAHAALGFVGASIFTALVPARAGAGLVAGLLVALSPIASFHGMESSNYAWTVFAGAMVLFGVAEPLRRRWWIALGLGLAAWNDVYSVWLGFGVITACWGILRTKWRRFVVPFSLVGLAAFPLIWMVVSRIWFGGEAAGVGMHAELAGADAGVWDLSFQRVRRLGGAALAGYAAGREHELWEGLPAMAFPILAGCAAIRSSSDWARRTGWMLAGGLCSLLIVGGIILWRFERVLPMEPRTLIGLVPALAVALVAGVGHLPPRIARCAIGIAMLLGGMATLQQHLDQSTLHIDAARHVLEHRAPGETVIAEERIRRRMLEVGVEPTGIVPCIDAMPGDGAAVWWVLSQPIEMELEHKVCQRSHDTHRVVDLTGWAVTDTWTTGPPEHERSAAGFVRPVSVIRLAPLETAQEAAGKGSISIDRAFLDGLTWGTVETLRLDPDEGLVNQAWFDLAEGEAVKVPLKYPVLHRVRVRSRARYLPYLPEWSVFDPFRRNVQSWEYMLIAPTLRNTAWTLPAASVRNPVWHVFRRLLSAVLVLMLAVAAFRPRSVS